MNEKFFSKEVLGEGVIGGGVVAIGTTALNGTVSGLFNVTGNYKTGLEVVLSVLEGYAAAVGEEKVKEPWLKNVMHGAKFIIPGAIPMMVADRAGVLKKGMGVDALFYGYGQRGRNAILTRMRGTK